MHEWALAEAVISTVEENTESTDMSRLQEVTVRLGELQNIDLAAFSKGLEMMTKGKGAGLDLFKLEIEKAVFHCNYCGTEWSLDDYPGIGEDEREAIHFLPESAHAYMKCPECGSSDFAIKSGRGVTIESIVLKDGEIKEMGQRQ
ncbi:MAG: hydrogenase nickel incorporation protein HypA [Spirochaetales bacterium]|nr:hydrogenase nickel incorporation protein HypA [Spirochaetales bacterium]